MTNLIILTLATLGSWDILRRLLPTRVPTVVGKILVVMIAYSLIRWAPESILLSLAVPGGLMILATFLKPEANVPWGAYVTEFIELHRRRKLSRPGTEAKTEQRIGHRMPPL